jgi:4-amino-4-deoxy-L-arabinose transferase-like glycosyltransferase
MRLLPAPHLGSTSLPRIFTPGRPDRHYLIAVVALAGCFILVAGAGRHYLTYGTETDFAGSFVPEARRFLRGDPLESAIHPPLYSIVIGLVYLITRNWFRAGLLVSWISGMVALVSSFLLFKELCGRAAGFGAVLGLLGSGLFVYYWGLATSDVFFLAGFMVSCLLAVRASRSSSARLWAACGIATGLCFITRTNAISLAVLVVAPLFGPGAPRAKGRSLLALLGGMALPVAALAIYAVATGSNLLPGRAYLNLAVTYFAQRSRGNWDDATRQVGARFTGIRDVLLYDPAAIARIYASNFYGVLATGITKLVEVPLFYAVLPGLVFLIGMHCSPALLMLAVVAVTQILFLNLTYFQPRLYLFLVPWLGAAAGEMFRRIADAPWPKPVQPAVVPFLALMWLLPIGQAGAKTIYLLSHGEEELSEAVPLARQRIGPGATVLASRSHVAFYSGASPQLLPRLAGLAELQEYAQARDRRRALYIFYGVIERSTRPQYAALAAGAPPPWLEVAARSRKPGGWVLLRVK